MLEKLTEQTTLITSKMNKILCRKGQLTKYVNPKLNDTSVKAFIRN
jgi:hypothetical protein